VYNRVETGKKGRFWKNIRNFLVNLVKSVSFCNTFIKNRDFFANMAEVQGKNPLLFSFVYIVYCFVV